MNISVKIQKVFDDPASPLKATATVVIDDCFMVYVKLIQTEKSTFMAMPSFRGRDGKWRDTSHPLTAECRSEMQSALIEAYNSR